jgi:hypothetical protein
VGKALAGSLGLIGQEHPLVEITKNAEDARQLGNDRPSPRLRRMSSQNQSNLGVVQQLRHVPGIDSVAGKEPHRLRKGASPRSSLGHFAIADAAYSLAVFREIDELEVVGEGANQGLSLVVRKTSHHFIELDPGLGIASTQILCKASHCLDLQKCAFTG